MLNYREYIGGGIAHRKQSLVKIIGFGVNTLVYISCKPTSLARDLDVLQARGYEVMRCVGIDQFPNTVHCETICLLSRIK